MPEGAIGESYFLHVLPANSGRTYRFIKFIRENFDIKQHKFIIDSDYVSVLKNNTRLLEFNDLFFWSDNYKTRNGKAFLLTLFKKSHNIIWHSLLFNQIDAIEYLLNNKSLIRKSSWIENGYDVFPNIQNKRAAKKGRILRTKMKAIGTIGFINSEQISKEYGRKCLSVCYPPEPGFYTIPESHIKHKAHSRSYRLMQIGSDARVFSNIISILTYVKKIDNSRRIKSCCLIIPQNVTLTNDKISFQTAPKVINNLNKMCIPYSLKNVSYMNIREYTEYYRCLDDVILSPLEILNPEYLLAPIFCDCNVYLLKNNRFAKDLPFCKFVNNVGKIDAKKIREMQKSENLPDIFSVFFPDKIKSKWEEFFEILLKESKNA